MPTPTARFRLLALAPSWPLRPLAHAYTFLVPYGDGTTGIHWADQNPATTTTIDVYYDFRPQTNTTTGITYPNAITNSSAETDLAVLALNEWSAATGGRLLFTRQTNTASYPAASIINIGLGDLAAVGGTSGGSTLGMGGASYIPGNPTSLSGGYAWLDQYQANWNLAYGQGRPGTSESFVDVLLHEVGHALGLGHSATPSAIMGPALYGENLGPTQDDISGIHALYGSNSSPSSQDYTALTYTYSAFTVGYNQQYNYTYQPDSNSLTVFRFAADAWQITVTGTTNLNNGTAYYNPVELIQSGGIWNHNTILVGDPNYDPTHPTYRSGLLSLTGGTLTANLLRVFATGTVALTGGTATIPAIDVQTGGTFTAGGAALLATAFTSSGATTLGTGVTWAANSTLSVLAGATTFTADAGSTASAPLGIVQTGGSLTLAATEHLRSLSVTAASATVSADGTHVLVTSSLQLLSAGQLDLANNTLLLHSSPAAFTTNYADLAAWLAAGRDGGLWDGGTSNALTSSTAHATRLAQGTELTGLALARATDLPAGTNSTFHGQTVDANTIIVRYTYVGDANLDGKISLDDYLAIDSGYLFHRTNAAYTQGDFNYDGHVNASDYALIDYSFAHQGSPLAQDMIALHTLWFGDAYTTALADLATPVPVPEPASLALAAGAGLTLLRRRPSIVR